jgi:hypothetical protein
MKTLKEGLTGSPRGNGEENFIIKLTKNNLDYLIEIFREGITLNSTRIVYKI